MRKILFVIILITSSLFLFSCGNQKIFNGNREEISKVEGELFLDGSDEDSRLFFKMGSDIALKIYDIIKKGEVGGDCKCQWIAYFTIYYSNGNNDTIEVTNTSIVRVNKAVLKVDNEKLLNILNDIK